MQEYAQKPEKSSSESNHKSSGQPPISEILQAYKNRTLQRMSVDDEELLQAKMRDKSSERETLQQYKDYTHRDKSRYNSFIQGMFDTPQRKGIEDEELLQGKFESSSVTSESPVQRVEKPNNTGLPDNLKSGIENLSGYSLDDVKVHYNSDKPAQLSALAYAQGTDIHIAPGQEQHLPHEAWHVVQQKQGRVQPTMQMQGVDVNDNDGLEREADVMGESGVNQGRRDSESISGNQLECKQLKGEVDNRMRSDLKVSSVQVPNNIIQNVLNNTMERWNQLHPGAAPMLTYENVLLSNDTQLITAWNMENGGIAIALPTAQNQYNQQTLVNNENAWITRKKEARSNQKTYLEDRLSDIGGRKRNYTIDYSVAYIGRDAKKSEGTSTNPLNNSLLVMNNNYAGTNQKFPFTLSSLLRTSNSDYGNDLQGQNKNKTFLHIIIANKIPVKVAPSHTAVIDSSITAATITNQLPILNGTISEIKYLACYGYRRDPSNDLLTLTENALAFAT